MANFLIVLDPDADRRRAFCRAAEPGLAPVAGLEAGQCSAGNFQALWAGGAGAPIASWADENGAAVVWGRALDDDGHAVRPEVLGRLWSGAGRTMPSAFDGYHAAVSYDARAGLTVGADLIGMYPVFWWSRQGVLLVGSSPELFGRHPLFGWELDPRGLAGILLTMHCVGGRTLTHGVRRLSPGHLLLAAPDSTVREARQYGLPLSTEHFDLPMSKATELLYGTLEGAVARHVPADATSTLALSGGRDSRLLAGLTGKLGRPQVALTFGNDDDIEMRCATAVANALKLAHVKREIPLDQQAAAVELHARWLHCSSGFNSVSYWGRHGDLQALAPYVTCGYAMDSVVGGSHIEWAWGRDGGGPSFDGFFARINASAVDADLLGRLLRPEVFGSSRDALIAEIRDSYGGYSPFEAQRAWGFDLHHRQRFHVGNPPWLFSFGAWPVLPAIDKALLKVAGGLAPAALAERRAQDEMIRMRFPALAELPLDRNSHDTRPLSPRLRYRIMESVTAKLEPRLRRLRRPPRQEHRFYYRLYDFNGPGWRLARHRAEPFRRRLYDLFDKDVLDRLLPPPDVDIELADKIVDASGRKLLVGLCFWARDHL